MAPAGSAPTPGLYDSRFEHDACGVGFIADLTGRPGHDVVSKALTALCNLEHRGAEGGDPGTGDGAGILTQIPDAFFREVCDFDLPPAGAYVAGLVFLPATSADRGDEPDHERDAAALAGQDIAKMAITQLAEAENLIVLGWRDVPNNPEVCGRGARAAAPHLVQLFLAGVGRQRGIDLERMAFCLRKRARREIGVYFASLSPRTIVYKGMLSAPQVRAFFPDLSDERYRSALALVHSRFSTNTFPSWQLAHPYRYIAHNGEINTVRATGTGCGPARRCWPAACSPTPPTGAASTGSSRCSTRTAATRPVSTSASNCCTWAAGHCRTRC